MNGRKWCLDVGGYLFYGVSLYVPYVEWKRIEDGVEDWPTMTIGDCEEAFERYEKANGAQTYYLEEEYGEDGEENDDYDPYLWMRPVDEEPDEKWYEITLDDAICWVYNKCNGEYNLDYDSAFTDEFTDKAIAAFREDPSWHALYDDAPHDVRRYLECQFTKACFPDLCEKNREEFDDLLDGFRDWLNAAKWEWLDNAMSRSKFGAEIDGMADEVRRYLGRARERRSLRAQRQNGSRLLLEIRRAHAEWQAGRMTDGQLDGEVNRIAAIKTRLEAVDLIGANLTKKLNSAIGRMRSAIRA